MVDGTESHSTVSSAVPAFERFLSEQEDPEPRETPPAQESPEPAPVEAEAAPETADAEGQAAETPEEQTDDAGDTPEPVTLDPTMKVKVKIDGQEQEVTLEEALKGYSRTADYTRKTQDLATKRQAQEAEFNAVREERQKYATYLTQLEQAIQQNAQPEPDWAKLQQTLKPEEFAAEFARFQIQQNEFAGLRAEKERAQAAVQKDQDKQLETHLASEHVKLLDAVPEWKVDATAKAEKAKLVAYATTQGWSEDDLGQVRDHRNIVMLRKAMLWDEQQAKKPAVQARIEKVRTATPGPAEQAPRKVSDETRALQRLAKTGKVADAAAAFFQMLPD